MHLVTLLERASISWKAWQEDISGDVWHHPID
jgi:hypothetical protein